MTRKALGRGLDALLPARWTPPEGEARLAGDHAISQIALEQIRVNRHQPRVRFDESRLRGLADSIRTSGIIQPLVVSPDQHGRYELVAGERRLRAARLAGLKEVPCVVKMVGETERMEMSLVENLQRDDLSPMEKARAYEKLLQQAGLTQDKAAERLGVSRSAFANTLRLLRAPRPVQEMLDSGALTEGHVRAILSLPTEARQVAAARRLAATGGSVREAEAKGRGRVVRQGSPDQRAVEEDLQRALGTRVLIRGEKKGRIEVHYYSLDDLNRLVRLLRGSG